MPDRLRRHRVDLLHHGGSLRGGDAIVVHVYVVSRGAHFEDWISSEMAAINL
jgi:hypothetical protein